jgi:hypothetical protein
LTAAPPGSPSWCGPSKEYSYIYMDQMPEQEIDIHEGLENTLI